MLIDVRDILVNSKYDLSRAVMYLNTQVDPQDFISCDSFDKLLLVLQQNYIDLFNIFIIEKLIGSFKNAKPRETVRLTRLTEKYNTEKDKFLKQTSVEDFVRAVVSTVKPILTHGKAFVTIRVSKCVYHQTLKDIEKLAMEAFEECHKESISMHAELGSIIISWVFPETLCLKLEELACRNHTVFETNGIDEVIVAGKKVFPCTQQVRIN